MFRVTVNMRYSEIVEFIIGMWPDIEEEYMSVTYKLPGYGKCLLNGDADIAHMIRVAMQLKESLVDIKVVVMETRESSDDEECGNAHNTQIVLLKDRKSVV